MLQPSSTETTETYTYKLAAKWGVHLDHVIVYPLGSLAPNYVNLVSLVRTLLNTDTSIDSVCDYLNKRTGRKWDTIVVNTLIHSLSEDLDIKNIMELGSSGSASAMKNLLVRINEFCRRRNINSYDLATAEYARSAFIRDRDASLVLVREKLRLLEETQTQYERAIRADVLRSSELVTFNESLHIIVKGSLSVEDTLTMFDNARVSSVLQHLICYYGNRLYQKVYKPGPFDSPVRRAAIMTKTIGHPPPGVLLFTISLTQVYNVRYTIESGIMETTIRMRDKEALIKAISDSFPTIKFEVRLREMEARLDLYPSQERVFDIPFYYLLHRTVVQPHLFQFYLNESTSCSPEKTTFLFRHRSFWDLPTTRANKIRNREETSFLISTPRMVNDTNYINISITSTSMNSTIRALNLLIPALCLHYIEDIVGVSPFFKIYNIPGLVAKSRAPGSKLRKELAQKWPEVFTKNYLESEETEAKNLVRVTTDPEEAKKWESDVIRHELTIYKREVLPFPPEADEGTSEVLFWFTSVSPEARRIGYRLNDYDDNPKYPYIPFSSIKGDIQKIKGISGGNVVSLAAQDEGNYAVAPDTLSHILGFKARRRGVAIGRNSVIRAILDAIVEVKGRIETVTDEDVSKTRHLIVNNYEPELYKQQLYDLSTDEIVQKMTDKTHYFDPLIYHAGLEELFGIDIYYIKAKIVQNVRTMTMELPRYTHFYCANRKRRNCLVIFINNGVRSDRLSWPHCELIVPSDSDSPLYGPDVSERLATIRERCHRFLVCLPDSIFLGSYMSSAMREVVSRFPSIVSQYVDPNGKARAFTVLSNEQKITIFCYPSVPMSLPHSSEVYPAPDKEWIEELCNNSVSGRSKFGVWCKDSTTSEVLYVRTAIVPEEVTLVGIDPLTSESSIEEASRFASEISTKDRLALVLREVIIWALDVSGLSPRKFSRRYLNYTLDDVDENTYYDISSIGRRLPPMKGIREVFSHLEKVIPVVDGRLVLHNEAYYKSIVYLLSKHPHKNYDPTIPRFIKNYYRSIGDFRSDKRVLILTGNIDPLTTTIDSRSKYAILPYVPEKIVGKLPIFYIQDNTFWIIQVTHLKEMKCAYNICQAWNEKRVNLGYEVAPIKVITSDVILYKVVIGRLVIAGRLRGNPEYENETPYEVLQLGPSNFAAMLRIEQ